jgi:hypothetical protein
MNALHRGLVAGLCFTLCHTYTQEQPALPCPCTHTAKGCQCLSKNAESNEEECCCIKETGVCACKEGTCCKKLPTNNAFIKTGFGELVDKITILEIKHERINDPRKLVNVTAELVSLTETLDLTFKENPDCITKILALKQELRTVNELIWTIEDILRTKEASAEFDDVFITNARAVYINNDKRCALKSKINNLLGSSIIEEKSYALY